MTAVSDLCTAMESIAPTAQAADWDNVGLLVGRRDAPAASVLLTIDLTSEVLGEAVTAGVDAIVSYHPPIFSPLNRINDSDETGRLLLGIIGAGIAVHSPHTALDAAPVGMNDWLAEALALGVPVLSTPAALRYSSTNWRTMPIRTPSAVSPLIQDHTAEAVTLKMVTPIGITVRTSPR